MSYERDNIRQMQGYTSGEQPEDADTIKLNTNENPWPPAPQIADAIRAFDAEALRRYPQPTADRFRRIASEIHGVKPENIIATRGGDELLRLVITTFVDPGQAIGMSEPTYSLYPVLAQIQNCPVIKMELDDNWQLPANFADELNKARAKLVLIVNPHAPSGRLLNIDDVARLAGALESVLLLDEAYVDFVDNEDYDATGLIDRFDNLIILRSLSKGYSLAGLRVGYGIGPASLIRPMMEKTRDSYNLDAFSQKVAETALLHRDYAAGTWQRVREERERLRQALQAMGWAIPPSQANFLLASIPGNPGAAEIYQRLKDSGILVRYFEQPRLKDKLRISVGTPAENDRLLAALEKILRGDA